MISTSNAEQTYDVVIVGAGPAGLESALVLSRQRRQVLLVDSQEYRNAPSQAAHMLIGIDGTPPKQIRDESLATLQGFPNFHYLRSEISSVQVVPEEDLVTVFANGVPLATCSRIILACGVRDHCDDIEGLQAAFGRTCFHCPYCHGYEVADRDLVAFSIPGTPALKSVHQACYLKDRISSKVRLVAPLEQLDADLLLMLQTAEIEVIDDQITKISDPECPLQLTTAKGLVISCDAGFVVPPVRAKEPAFIERLSLKTKGNFILVDDHCRTSIPQIFAAGDIAITSAELEPLTFVGQAIGKGQQAAIWADQDLFMKALSPASCPKTNPQ